MELRNASGQVIFKVNGSTGKIDSFGSQATTPYQVRGGLADDIQAGWFATFAGRISTMASPSTVTLASATLVPPWCAVKL